MNTDSSTTLGSNIIVVVLALVAVSLVYVVATGRNLTMPIIATDRAALIALLVVGIAMCAVGGIGKAIDAYGWSNPVTIIGSVIGVLTLVVVGAVLFGVRLPIITDERAAFVFVAGVIVAKIVFNLAVLLFNR